ncbi:hypothetical protein ACFL17_08140 [Pseudomonadota bacterium]
MFCAKVYPAGRNRLTTHFFSIIIASLVINVLLISITYAQSFRTFQSEKYGFSAQFPDTWKFEVNKQGDMVFSSDQVPGGAIVIQFIDRAANKGSSTKKQLVGIWEQIAQLPDAALDADNLVPMAGGKFPYFIARYTPQGSVQYGHIQVALERGKLYYLVSFSAPKKVYDQNLKIFQHMAATWTFAPGPSGQAK